MTSAPSFSTGVPLSGNTILDDSISQVPIHVVSHASQLPSEFMEPLAERPLVIGFDCEGVDLCKNGSLCVMQLAFPDAVYLVDVIQGGVALMEACKPALESSYITKVIHDCKRDSEALFFQFGIKLHNVVDTQIAYSLIEEQEGKERTPDDYISFVDLVADPRYCGVPYLEKEEVKVLLSKDPMFWTHRPMSDLMVRTAADDDMDWPPTALLPDNLRAEGYSPEEEILSVLSVPIGKMGRVIGKRGSSIRPIKESCNAEILIGGYKGPPNKVFIIGPISQVRKAEALLRGCMLDF